MVYRTEKEMYKPVVRWLRDKLQEHFHHKDVSVYDTHAEYLSDFLPRRGIRNIVEYPSYEIKVDVTGIISNESTTDLVFVECKLKRISLKDLSQLLGYSKVARPLHSFITSPKGFTHSIQTLFTVYNRYDVLSYFKNRQIVVFKWNESREEPDYSQIIPRGITLF